jgi:hypothetical protein
MNASQLRFLAQLPRVKIKAEFDQKGELKFMVAVLEQIKPETAARLAAQAQKQGISIDDLIQSLLPAEATVTEIKAELTPQEKARLWREWVENNSVKGVIADDSRESIYTREDEAL